MNSIQKNKNKNKDKNTNTNLMLRHLFRFKIRGENIQQYALHHKNKKQQKVRPGVDCLLFADPDFYHSTS